MTSNKFEEIANLKRESDRITEFFNKKLPNIKKQYADPHNSLDKHYDGFIEGDAIQSWDMNVCYRSFSGYNGVSSTYSDFHPDRKIMTEYFLRYLNEHTDEIFHEIAQMMLEDARKMKADAIKELEEMKAELGAL
nr:MAG TPA: hypothetical protein [Caudoviricetes sp.]